MIIAWLDPFDCSNSDSKGIDGTSCQNRVRKSGLTTGLELGL
jgi:hypothetical protein